MKNLDLTALLRGNPYPGRGIVLGSSPDGEKSVVAYFITVSYTHLTLPTTPYV